MWRLGTVSSIKVLVRIIVYLFFEWLGNVPFYVKGVHGAVSFHLCMVFGASADRCIQNIYRQLRQETGTPKKYPGVLASLLMLDKLSIEDIKASVTELMAGGVDTVKIKFF